MASWRRVPPRVPTRVKLRDSILARLDGGAFDVLVLGGGINGAVSAACLAARGVRVALIDRSDFAGETSQESSNLAWGGIKYMEGGEYGLVRKLCRSRNHLIRSYPSTIREVRFFTTVQRGFRRMALNTSVCNGDPDQSFVLAGPEFG